MPTASSWKQTRPNVAGFLDGAASRLRTVLPFAVYHLPFTVCKALLQFIPRGACPSLTPHWGLHPHTTVTMVFAGCRVLPCENNDRGQVKYQLQWNSSEHCIAMSLAGGGFKGEDWPRIAVSTHLQRGYCSNGWEGHARHGSLPDRGDCGALVIPRNRRALFAAKKEPTHLRPGLQPTYGQPPVTQFRQKLS